MFHMYSKQIVPCEELKYMRSTAFERNWGLLGQQKDVKPINPREVVYEKKGVDLIFREVSTNDKYSKSNMGRKFHIRMAMKI